jgi:hypothetical protein
MANTYGSVLYRTNDGIIIPLICPYYVTSLIVNDVDNLPPSGKVDLHFQFRPNFYGKLDQPIRTRHVKVMYTSMIDIPPGVDFDKAIRIPILDIDEFRDMKNGQLGSLAGYPIVVVELIKEKIPAGIDLVDYSNKHFLGSYQCFKS